MGKISTIGKLVKNEAKISALNFLNSFRGQYIVSQALYIAIEQLEKIKPPMQEVSNISDMRFLLNTLFPTYKITEKIRKQTNERRKS